MKRAEFLKVMGAGTLVALAGSAVTVTTSNTSGHTHDFVISKWY
jgi:hypothetical protein